MGVSISIIIPIFDGENHSSPIAVNIPSPENIEVILAPWGEHNGDGCTLASELQDSISDILLQPRSKTLGEARNRGVSAASGTYLWFGDVEDIAYADGLLQVIRSNKNPSIDIYLVEGYAGNSSSSPLTAFGPQNTPINSLELSKDLYQITDSSPCRKLFKREFLLENALSFLPAAIDHDPSFTYLALSHAGQIAWLTATPRESEYKTAEKGSQHREDPFGILQSISLWFRNSPRIKRCAQEKESYQLAALELVKRQLLSFNTDRGRIQFLEKLADESYLSAHDLTEDQLSPDPKSTLEIANFIEAALDQFSRETSLVERPPAQTIIPPHPNQKPRVSVVMPVFNAMPYLTATLTSIAQQTLSDIEIICVDDGSSDNSLDQLLSFSTQDPRFIIISQPNRGQSSARNIGIDTARGEYIYFMDSDDILASNALELLVARSDELNLELLCFDADVLYDSAELANQFPSFEHAYERPRWYDAVYRGCELLSHLQNDGTYLQSPCLYLTKRSFLQDHKIRFIEGILHEDNAFTFSCFIYAERASHINEPLFRRRVREGSTMTSRVRFARPYGYFRCYADMFRVYGNVEANLPDWSKAPILRIVYTVLGSSRATYEKMIPEDRGCSFGLIYDFRPFTIAVVEPAMKNLQLQKAQRSLSKTKKELKKVRASRSFRLGKLFMTPLTTAKKALKRLHDQPSDGNKQNER